MIALLAPGQGAQALGMLSSWLSLDGSSAALSRWSELTGLDLERLGTTAGAGEITDTAVTQPLVVAAALLTHRHLRVPADTLVAGHSVGELAAAAVAGVISDDDAVQLAAVRGAAMKRACAVASTGMSAVLGGDPEQVLARLTELGLEAANRNGAGQVVAAGPVGALAELKDESPGGARVVPLAVAGAFHTAHMAPAQDQVRAHAATVAVTDPDRTLLSNADGAVITDGRQFLDRIVAQITSAVRWDLCMQTAQEYEVTAVVELPPAGTLTGLARRELKGVPATALKSPEDLDAVAGAVAR